MTAFILSNIDLAIKDALSFDSFTFSEDIELLGKSSIVVVRQPIISSGDFVVCKNENETVFFGICENYSSKDGQSFTISLLQAERFFDRFIFVGQEDLIASDGIEDFIASEISENWVNSGDQLLDRDYISARPITHTRINAKVSTIGSVQDGVYNLKTFLGNAKEYYRIFLSMDVGFSDELVTDSGTRIVNEVDLGFYVAEGSNRHGKLYINIRRDESEIAPLDVTVSEVANYAETYKVDVIAKLIVKWAPKDSTQVTEEKFFLKTNRTITQDQNDPNRAAGSVRSVFIEADTRAEMVEEVTNTFSSNKYEHKISLQLMENSKAYPSSAFYVGRPVMIKTAAGIRETIVTASSKNNSKGFVTLTFGKLKVNLIEKLRG